VQSAGVACGNSHVKTNPAAILLNIFAASRTVIKGWYAMVESKGTMSFSGSTGGYVAT
jgi:hypothetical protein